MFSNTTRKPEPGTAHREIVVLIPNYNGKALLTKCLRTLEQQTFEDFAIVIADDASTDDDVAYLRANAPAVDVLPLPKNRGFAGAVNAGLRYALETYTPAFIAILNNDTEADAHWLASLVARARTDEKIAAVTSNMFFAKHPDVINSQGGTIDWNGDGYDINFGIPRQHGKRESGDTFGACWGGSLLRTDALRDIGLLDETLGAYFEDLDWSWRANLFGWRIVFEKDAILLHAHSASYKHNTYRKLFYCKRNALRTALKNWGRGALGTQVAHILLGYWFAIVGYFHTDKYRMPLRKKFLFVSIPFAALFWNITHLPSSLRARREVQTKRTVDDAAIEKLMQQDPTPVREWLAHLRKRLFMRPSFPVRAPRGLMLTASSPAQITEIRNGFGAMFEGVPFQPTAYDAARLVDEARLIDDLCIMTLECAYRGKEKQLDAVFRKLAQISAFLKTHDLDWDAVVARAARQNASSLARFWLGAAAETFGAPIPDTALAHLERNGSRVQNLLFSNIKAAQFGRNKGGIFLAIYSKLYLREGLVRHAAMRLHARYNKANIGAPQLPRSPVFGVNIFGFLDSESGVGEAARSIVRAIRTTSIPYALVSSGNVPHRRKETDLKRYFTHTGPYAVNLIAVYGDMFETEWERIAKKALQGTHTIAYWAWELETLPEAWARACAHIDEIWTPSEFSKRAIEKACALPVAVIPHALALGEAPYGRDHFNLPKDTFLFLFMFDFYSLFERKNPMAVIEAFKTAFPKEENAMLVIKCSNAAIDPRNYEMMKTASEGLPITILDGYLDRREVTSLLGACDAYVSLHRAEGFGLTIAEAMAMGKPVIATNYSGNTDFMTEENSFPVDYRLVPLEENYGPYTKGNRWAEPDIAHAARLMRLVFENDEVCLRHALKGRDDIMRMLNPETIGKKIRERLLLSS